MWFKEHDRYICKIENFAYREINEQSFSNPHPSKDEILGVCCELPIFCHCRRVEGKTVKADSVMTRLD